MEEPQKKIMNKIRSNLLHNMLCDTTLLAKLQEKNLITSFEVDTVESKNTNAEKCICLIDILLTKQHGFLKLYEALVEQKQSGASFAIFTATKHKLPKDHEQMVEINSTHECAAADEIYFHHSPPNMHEFLSSGDFKICIISTINCELTTKKIRDTVPNVFVKIKFSRNIPGQITLWTETNDICKLLEKLSKTINDDKHIIVTTNTAEIINELVKTLHTTDKVLEFTDTFSWNDFTDDFQTKILSHKVKLLNKLLTLKEMFETHGIEEDLIENLGQQCLVQLVNNEVPSMFKNTIPFKPNYYVTRTIQSRYLLSLKRIEDFEKDIFLFSGWKDTDMTSYFKKMTNTASSQILQRSITVQFILLESESQFALICELTARPIHWIHNDNHLQKFMWIKSRGDISSIQKMIHPNIQEPIHEFEFTDKVFSNKHITDFYSPVCIVDSPGMGKTELLANIARSLQITFPDQLVVFVRASDFVVKVQEKLRGGLRVTLQMLSEFILEIVCKNNLLIREVFQSCMKSGLKINLLLDGYDEIPSTVIKLAENILNLLCNRESIRIFVSSRVQNLESLEKTINVLAYRILPFSKKEQHQFLFSYWTHSSSNEKSFDLIRLEQFTSECLTTLDKQIPKCDRDFAGIPLQCLLIGMVFQNSAWEYSKSGNHFSEFSNIGVHSVSDLFEQCINVKFQEAVRKHQIVDFDEKECMYAHACHAIKLMFPDHPVQLQTDAKQLFKFGILEQSAQDDPSEIQPFLHRTFAEYFVSCVIFGKLQTQNITYINLEDSKLPLELLFTTSERFTDYNFHGQVTFDFVNWMCLYFVNQKCGEVSSFPKSSSVKIKRINFNHCIRHMALSCAKRDFQNILYLVLKTKHKHLRQPQFVESLLFASVCFANLPLIQYVCEYFEKVMCTSKVKYGLRHVTVEDAWGRMLTSLLHVAAEQGKYDVVEYLCKERGFARLVENLSLHGLAHTLARSTEYEDENKIQQKLKILEYLYKLNRNILMEVKNGHLPLFSCESHPTIIRHFINLMHQDSHFASSLLSLYVLLPDDDLKKSEGTVKRFFSSTDQFHFKELHKLSLKRFVQNLLGLKINLSEEFLMAASILMELNTIFDMTTEESIFAYQKLSESTNEKYFELLQTYHVNFNVVCDTGKNLLHMLSPQGSVQFLHFLIEAGVSVNLRDDDGKTPLHNLLAQERCNESIIKTLIQEMLLNVDNENDCWESLLEIAVKYGNSLAVTILLEKTSHKIGNYNALLYHAMINWKHGTAKQTKIIKSLIEYGADINILTSNFDLQQKINSSELGVTFPILERLMSCGFKCSSVAATNTLVLSIGDNATYSAKYKKRLFRHLLELGADLNLVDEDGNTLLHYATHEGQLKYIQMLIENGLSPNCLNYSKQTPLHVQIKDKSNHLRILEILVTAGGDLCAKDGKNQVAFVVQTQGDENFTIPFVKLLLRAITNFNVDMLSEVDYITIGKILVIAIYAGLGESEQFLGLHNSLLLHSCIRFNQTKLVEALLTTNALVNIKNKDGNTPLHLAFIRDSGNHHLIKSLVGADADVNIKNKLGHTPVECFRFGYETCSYTETFKFLGIDLKNVPNIIVKNCLKATRENKSASGLHFLSTLATGRKNVLQLINDVKDDFFLRCASQNSLSLIRFLHCLGKDLITTDLEYNTTLHYSLSGENASPQNFHFLLDYAVATGNGDLLTIENNKYETPLTCAVKKFDLLACSIQLFKQMDAGMEYGDPIQLILEAVKSGQSLSFIKRLQNLDFYPNL